ncbi:MAG: glycosyltransferase family 39 protein [Patescibacteria group bacterium]
MIRRNLTKVILVLIIALAFFLRFYKVTFIPPSLNWDETSIAYNAYSILKTGKDEWGKVMPIHFRSYGEFKLPGQIYASIPAVAIFGLTELGIRITPVIYGTLTVLLLYLLTFAMFKKRSIALMAAFFLAISPWHIQLTRASLESSFALFWFVMGVWFLVKGFKKPKWLIFSMIPFAAAIYTYNSARVFAPMFLVAVALLNWKYFWKVKKWFILAGVTFVILLIPLVPFVLSGEAGARYKLVSITDEAGLVPRINERRGNSTLPGILPRLIHNKGTYLSFYFAQNYLAHFTPNFLFIEGAGHRQHHVQGVGELFWIQAPFLLLGLYFLFKKKDLNLKILVPWLLLAFIPVAVTNDSIPNTLRTLNAAPIYQIFTALGIYYFWEKMKSKKLAKTLILLSTVILIINFGIYMKNLFLIYPVKYSRDWQYGNKQVVSFIKENYEQYDLITFTRHYGEPHMFTLFYLKYDPAKFQTDPTLVRFETYDWVRVLKFDKFYFPDLGDLGTRYQDVINENPGKKILFVGKPGDFPSGTKILKDIYFLNGDKAFEITTN